jgi:dTDP-4-dehydrorhamnose 3,5-epimerase-like enzyme
VFADACGHFFESYNRRALAEHGITADFVRRPPF